MYKLNALTSTRPQAAQTHPEGEPGFETSQAPRPSNTTCALQPIKSRENPCERATGNEDVWKARTWGVRAPNTQVFAFTSPTPALKAAGQDMHRLTGHTAQHLFSRMR